MPPAVAAEGRTRTPGAEPILQEQAGTCSDRSSRAPASEEAGRAQEITMKKILASLTTTTALVTLVAVVSAAAKWN